MKETYQDYNDYRYPCNRQCSTRKKDSSNNTVTHNSFAEKFCIVTLHQLVSLTFTPNIIKQEPGAVFLTLCLLHKVAQFNH